MDYQAQVALYNVNNSMIGNEIMVEEDTPTLLKKYREEKGTPLSHVTSSKTADFTIMTIVRDGGKVLPLIGEKVRYYKTS